MNIIILSIGTNLGNRQENLVKAVTGIRETIGHVLISSSVYETEPWGFQTTNQFLNIVLKVETNLEPSEVLKEILKIENMLGRIRVEKQYTSRLIDIDILLFGDRVIDDKDIKVPHPLMHERMFVLVPLCEIASDMVHPTLKKPFGTLLKTCEDKGKVRLYGTER